MPARWTCRLPAFRAAGLIRCNDTWWTPTGCWFRKAASGWSWKLYTVSRMKRKRFNGFIALESLLILLILILILFYTLQTVAAATRQTQERWEAQQRFNKLVSVADYIVKAGAVREYHNTRYPNWIDEARLAALPLPEFQEQMNLSSLAVGFSPSAGSCIYRLVVVGDSKEIRRLFICAA